MLYSEAEGRLVCLGQNRLVNGYSWQVDSLEGRQGAAIAYPRFDPQAVSSSNFQPDGAVGDEDLMPGPKVTENFGVREGQLVTPPGAEFRHQGDFVALIQVDQPV